MTAVLLVDTRPIVVSALATALDGAPDIDLVGRVSSIGEAERFVAQTTVDVALVDLRLPDGLGLAILRNWRSRPDRPAVVIMAAADTPQFLDPAIKLGAAAFIDENATFDVIVATIRRAAQGLRSFTSEQRRIARRLPWAPLTSREAELVAGLLKGRSNDALSRDLGVSRKTIETYMTRLFERHGLRNRVQLAVAAQRDGWLDISRAQLRPAKRARRRPTFRPRRGRS